MITDRWVWHEQHVPGDLLHRHTEIQALSRALQPALHGERAHDIFISGPSGVGKTVTSRYTISRLMNRTGVASTRIRCLSKSRAGILYHAVSDYPTDVAVHRNESADELLRLLEDIIDEPYVLLLDEADGLPEVDVLDDLAQIPQLSVICIAHNPTEWFARLDDRAHTRFPLNHRIEFDRYSPDELAEILGARAIHGLEPDVVTTAQLRRIADEVAGVARYGIQSLRAAAELATERDHRQIHDDDIADSFARARAEIRASNLRSLSFGHHVVYELVREAGELETGAIHEAYHERAPALYVGRDQVPVGDRQVRNYLNKLVEYDLVSVDGETRWRRYRVCDETLSAPVEIAED